MIVVRHSYISARRQGAVGGKPAKLVALGKALAHVKYIQHRPGEDKHPDSGGRELFSESENNLDGKRVRQAIKDMRDSKVLVHKITLAPEINPTEKMAFTREVMHRLGSEKGLDLQWAAVVHNNTDHHHIHVVVLGKDQNGKDVRFDKKDYDRIKEYGDRYLERCHPLELERARSERERKAREKIEQRIREREERIRDGLELPWMHQQVLREQLEPYSQWKERQLEKERAKAARRKEKNTERIEALRMRDEKPAKQPDQQQERQLENREAGAAESKEQLPAESEVPIIQDTIEAAGKTWSKQNTLAEMQQLNQHLWDNYAERISRDDYKKLLSWMKEKEGHPERLMNVADNQKERSAPAKTRDKSKDQFEHKGEVYNKDSSYEKLTELSKKLRENKTDWLPVKNYQQLRGWIENADRARWSGVIDKQLEMSKQKYARDGANKIEFGYKAEATPFQKAVNTNPAIGLFVKGAKVVDALVRWIPLIDKRDRLKEGLDAMKQVKQEKHKDYVAPGRTVEEKARDKEAIDRLDKAIDANKETREKAKEDKKKQRKRDDPHMFDPWGRY